MSADDLALALVSRLRVHSVGDALRWLGQDATDDRDCGRCPRCGRSLPLGSVSPAFQSFGWAGTIGIPHTREELIAACLVDGRRARRAQDFPLDELIGAAQTLTSALRERGWKHWAARMEDALAERPEAERAETIGQALELIRTAGPPTLKAQLELEILVTSLARYWPQGREPS